MRLRNSWADVYGKNEAAQPVSMHVDDLIGRMGLGHALMVDTHGTHSGNLKILEKLLQCFCWGLSGQIQEWRQ